MYVDNAFHVENITVPYSLKDSGRMDAQGNFYFLGRTDDIVGVRGRKVSMMNLRQQLKEKLSDFEIPKRVIVLEALPKNTSGKVDKAQLKKMWMEQEPQ